MKYEFMKTYEATYSIERMSKVFKICRSGYYKFKKSGLSNREKENIRLLGRIKRVHEESRQTYGSPRIWAELKAQGESCSRKRIAKIMQKVGLAAKMKKRFKITTKTNDRNKIAPNLLAQNFKADCPDQRWVADITYINTLEGFLYLAAILDLFSRKIVGLAMSERINSSLVSNALKQAVIHRAPEDGLVYHSDKGCQYTSSDFQKQLKIYGMTPSMSGTGNCYDNSPMESFFHTLKTEHVYFENYATREQAKISIFEYIEAFYNRKRRHSTLGYLSPTDFEKKWQAEQHQNISLLSV